MELQDLRDDVVPLANLTGIQFGLLTKDDITTISVIPSLSKPKDVVDSRLGIPNQSRDKKCSTCGASDIKCCDGHFGYIYLPRFIYNPHLIADTVEILNNVCPSCLSLRKIKRKPKVSKYLSLLNEKEASEKGRKRALSSEKVGSHEAELQADNTMVDPECVSQDAKMNGASGETAYMVSSDEEYMGVSEFSKLQDNCQHNEQKTTNPKRTPNTKTYQKGKTTGKSIRILPPRKSKMPVHYAEKALMKSASGKLGLTPEITKKIADQGSKFSSTDGKRRNLRARKCNDSVQNAGKPLHSSNSLREHLVGNTEAQPDDWEGCRYCSTEVENKHKLYPSVKFRVASKQIRGKAFPSILMQIELNRGKKVQDIDWSNCLGHDYWGFIAGGQHDFLGAVQTTRPLLPFEARELIKKIREKGIITCPEALFLDCVPVTPNFHRITERYHKSSNGPGLTYDDRTRALQNLLNNIDGVKGMPPDWITLNDAENLACSVGGLVLDYFQASKLASAKSLIAQSIDICKTKGMTGLKWVKDTLLGKRSNLSVRMTTIGDPNIAVDQICIPVNVAENLTICEMVNFINWGELKDYVDQMLTKSWLLIRRNGNLLPISHSNQLEIGDIVLRKLKDGDLILVNRPPSSHQHSLIAMRVKLRQFGSIVAINPLVCTPFGADFDGDCLHGFIPQLVKCVAEAGELMTLPCQMINTQGGQSLIALTHDSLLSGHIITSNHIFFDKFQIQQLQMFCSSPVPKPAILKAPMLGSPLWTSYQLFSMVLPTDLNYTNSAKGLIVLNGELLCRSGRSDWLQNSSDSLVYAITQDCPSRALDYLYCAQAVLSEWISMNGFSVSLSDVHLASNSYCQAKMMDEVRFGLLEAKQSSYSVHAMYDSPARKMLLPGQYDCLSEYLRNVRMVAGKGVKLRREATQEFKNIYSDIIKVVREHVEKDNALLAMINAGSKGSLQKLVQLGACLGLQMYKEEEWFPFEVPQKLCCSQWIPNSLPLNKRENLSKYLGAVGSIEKWYSRGLVENSFCDGLNPLEYFIHGVSSRGNSFDQAADVPGQLFRKLMFFLRDVYVAYDGTVRSTYGQQIMQFSYGAFEQNNQTKIKENTKQVERWLRKAGEPVGALAASSIGKLAYSILEKQCETVKDQTLHILKEVLCVRPTGRNGNVNKSVTLRLSKKLRKIHSGLEYGAIELQEHLQKVILSDLTTSVRIMYEKLGESVSEAMKIPISAFSPWVTHILLSKKRLKKKKLTVQSVIGSLYEEYNSSSKKCPSLNLPVLFIFERDQHHFQVSVEEESDGLCLIVLTEISSTTLLQDDVLYSEAMTNSLDLTRDFLIPRLLDVVIKGHAKIESVKIRWEENSQGHGVEKNSEEGELVLVLSTSSGTQPRELWNIVLNACEPLADLIDWQRSGPESIYEVWHTMGIEAARNFCLQRLKHTSSVMGKPVHEDHLLLIVDCLSVTGFFHGLTPTGLRKQQNQTSVSAPFMQGCFTKPKKRFLEAAKKGTLDNLAGTLDALAWGKVAPIGTGVPFDILLNEKKQEPMKCADVCELLKEIRDTRLLAFESDPIESFQHMDSTENFEVVDRMSNAFVHLDISKFEMEEDGFPPGFEPDGTRKNLFSSKRSREGKDSCQLENFVNKIGEADLPPGFEPCKHANVHVALQDDAIRRQQCSKIDCRINSEVKDNKASKDECSKHKLLRILSRSKFPESIDRWEYLSLMVHSLREMLHKRYRMGEILPDSDKSIVIEALRYHPRSKAKIGIGIQGIKIGSNPSYPQSRCFILVRKDGSVEDFSFHKCLKGLVTHFSPSLAIE